jgi:hypothetical protein
MDDYLNHYYDQMIHVQLLEMSEEKFQLVFSKIKKKYSHRHYYLLIDDL